MPSVSITWHTLKDGHKICPVCVAIDGYTWTFTDEIPFSLTHPVYGEVWNKSIGSLAHASHKVWADCKCSWTAEASIRDLIDKAKQLRDDLKEELDGPDEPLPDVKTGNRRGTTFEDIGIDPSKYGFE